LQTFCAPQFKNPRRRTLGSDYIYSNGSRCMSPTVLKITTIVNKRKHECSQNHYPDAVQIEHLKGPDSDRGPPVE